jgi:hypothetical protein
MAHFAELDSSNVVLRIVVISNSDVDANGGDLSAEAETFVGTLIPFINGVAWKQTSYNNNFRKQYASIGGKYDAAKDKFLRQQPYPSWALDGDDEWQAPITRPNIIVPKWDEDNLRWKGETFTDADPSVILNYRWDVPSLEWVEL